jgi:hypothetical protein
MPMSRSGHRTTLRRGFPCSHRDITSTVGRPMAARRRGWRARRLSGRGIGRVLSSPPSDGLHGLAGGPGPRRCPSVPPTRHLADLFGASRDRRRCPVGCGAWRPPSAAWGAAVRPLAGARDRGTGDHRHRQLSELTTAQTLSSRACVAGGSGDFPSTHQSAEGSEIRHVASRVLHTSTRRTPVGGGRFTDGAPDSGDVHRQRV